MDTLVEDFKVVPRFSRMHGKVAPCAYMTDERYLIQVVGGNTLRLFYSWYYLHFLYTVNRRKQKLTETIGFFPSLYFEYYATMRCSPLLIFRAWATLPVGTVIGELKILQNRSKNRF